MWFLLFVLGVLSLPAWRFPAGVPALPCPPSPEARLALFFLVAALLRLVVLRARVAALERRARRVPRRELRFALAPPGLLEMGTGIGKGVAEAVMGNPVGAAWAGAALLLRIAASRGPEDPAVAARRAAERKRVIAREWRRAALCIAGVGLVCAAVAWWPIFASRAPTSWGLALTAARRLHLR